MISSQVCAMIVSVCQHASISYSKLAAQGLQQEVARRQMAVLDRTSASPDLPQTMHERQASLRCGRSFHHAKSDVAVRLHVLLVQAYLQ